MNIGAVWAQAKGVPVAAAPAVTYTTGDAPAGTTVSTGTGCTPATGTSIGALLVVSLLATGIVLFIKRKVDTSREEDDCHLLADHLSRMEFELEAQREDIALSRTFEARGLPW
jgi:hypothetical protein